MSNLDRRVQRTRKLLQDAMMQLIREKGYDAITVQDILDRANIGRATFYAHYQSKEDLFLAHHDDLVLTVGLEPLTAEQLLSPDPPPSLVAFLELLGHNRSLYQVIIHSRDSDRIRQGLRAAVSVNLADCLQSGFEKAVSHMPLDALTEYLASAQLALIDWWLNQRTPYTAQQIATMLHQLRRAALQEAFALD
ncbi:MAG TPA: TetR/AcrR family transcriptional regulator [Aggregatilineaceae bacterium]|nr:TetR/AcrR family transcriptional regulator [Aggregatilineaceae bacterium]